MTNMAGYLLRHHKVDLTEKTDNRANFSFLIKSNLPLSSICAKAVTNAVGVFVASVMLPYSVAENPGFKHFFGVLEPCYKMPIILSISSQRGYSSLMIMRWIKSLGVQTVLTITALYIKCALFASAVTLKIQSLGARCLLWIILFCWQKQVNVTFMFLINYSNHIIMSLYGTLQIHNGDAIS